MKPSLQDFYNYVFRNEWANPAADIPDKISADAKAKQIQTRVKKMQSLFDKDTISEADRPNFRKLLRDVKASHLEQALFGNTTDELKSEYKFPASEAIVDIFKSFGRFYCYFPESKVQEKETEKFNAFFLVSKIIGDFVEHNNNEKRDWVAYLHAYKMLIIFGNQDDPRNFFQAIDKYIASHNYYKRKQPLHDALMANIPKFRSTQHIKMLTQWRDIIQNTGAKGFELFSRALEIEDKLAESYPVEAARQKILATYKSALNYAKSITYKRFKEYEALAEVFLRYNLSEALFNKALDFDQQRKKTDAIPDVMIDGGEIGSPGYYLVKLPMNLENANDKYRALAYVLGHITNCCQSMGGNSEGCVKDGIKYPHNGFLLLLRKKSTLSEAKLEEKKSTSIDVRNLIDKCRIVGQGYIWFSAWGNLVIDSWENLHATENGIAAELLRKFSENILADKNSTVLQMAIGAGGNTPVSEFKISICSEGMREGAQYGDSMKQLLIASDTSKQEKIFNDLQAELKDIIHEKIDAKASLSHFIQSNFIISPQHAQAIKGIFRDEKYQTMLQHNYALFDVSQKVPLFYFARLWSTLGLLFKGNICPDKDFIDKYMSIIKSSHTFSYGQQDPDLATPLQLENLIYKFMKEDMLDREILNLLIHANATELLRITELEPIFIAILRRGGICMPPDIRLKLVDLLIARKANVNERAPDDLAPVHILISESIHLRSINMEILEKILKNGANPNLEVVRSNSFPLISVVETGYMKLLLEAKADPNKCNSYGAAALHGAASNHKVDRLKLLLEAKANPSIANVNLDSPLHVLLRAIATSDADVKNVVDAVKLLIEHRANINAQAVNGDTPLHVAYEYGHSEVVKVLLANGANPDVKNKLNRLPADIDALGMSRTTVSLFMNARFRLFSGEMHSWGGAAKDMITESKITSPTMIHSLFELSRFDLFIKYWFKSKRLLEKFKAIGIEDKNYPWLIMIKLYQNNSCTEKTLDKVFAFISLGSAEDNHSILVALDFVVQKLSEAKLLNPENMDLLTREFCIESINNPEFKITSQSDLTTKILFRTDKMTADHLQWLDKQVDKVQKLIKQHEATLPKEVLTLKNWANTSEFKSSSIAASFHAGLIYIQQFMEQLRNIPAEASKPGFFPITKHQPIIYDALFMILREIEASPYYRGKSFTHDHLPTLRREDLIDKIPGPKITSTQPSRDR